jgi:tRNA threonylcarbamoyladenosine biosynthesis protein TsaB
MERFILIETSTALCSAALSENGKIISYRESSAPKAHASLTAVFIDEMLKENGLTLADCSAVCVSEGPGSYTGLRVGVSTAKGLCFGANLPLLAVGTLDVLVHQAREEGLIPAGCATIVPMIDARRMEVYSSTFDVDGTRLRATEPKIIDQTSYADELEKGGVLFIGDGAGKCEGTIVHPNATFVQCSPKASAMAQAAADEYKEKRFKDVAYFEPFYLKDFVATVSKKKLF